MCIPPNLEVKLIHILYERTPDTHHNTPQRNPFVHMTIIRFVINKWDVPMHYYKLNTINRWIY